ncbi:MAG TPA: START domain-containing protein, partial [bacterium]|nr:START domain-containing protein [bacterium]
MRVGLAAVAALWLLASGARGQTPVPTPPAAAPAPVDEASFTWQQPSQADGILLYWSKVQGSDLVAFKGEGIVDAPLDKVATIIADTSRGTEWIDGLVKSQVVDRASDTDFVEYDHQGVPFPFDQLISDRDFVSRVTLTADPNVHGLTIRYVSVQDPAAPPPGKCVRGELRYCVF